VGGIYTYTRIAYVLKEEGARVKIRRENNSKEEALQKK
jgi:hypothetical protein